MLHNTEFDKELLKESVPDPDADTPFPYLIVNIGSGNWLSARTDTMPCTVCMSVYVCTYVCTYMCMYVCMSLPKSRYILPDRITCAQE